MMIQDRYLPPPLDCKRYVESMKIQLGEDVFSIVKKEFSGVGGKKEETEHDEYEKLGVAGIGSGGMVIKVKNTKTGRIYARKSTPINWSETSTDELPKLMVTGEYSLAKAWAKCATRETKILMKLRNKHIVKFEGAYVKGNELFTLMEYVWPGNLKLVSSIMGPIREDYLIRIGYQILKGLEYLWKMRIVHRDIKPSNIMFSSDGIIKLADFGISIDIDDHSHSRTCLGSHGYLAPELILSETVTSLLSPPKTPEFFTTHPGSSDCFDNLAFCSDVWSYGIVILEMGLGKYPYPSFNANIELFAYICQEEPPKLPEPIFSENLSSFVTSCLLKEPLKRPSITQLLLNPLFLDCAEGNLRDLAELMIKKANEEKQITEAIVCSNTHLPHPLPSNNN